MDLAVTMKKRDSGFTLIEVVLVIILVSIIAGITGSLILYGAESYSIQYERRDLMYQAKTAMMRMDKEIRMIRSAGPGDIITFTADGLEFVNIDGQTIGFALSGSNILRSLNGVSNILAKDVSGLTFSYLKKDGTPAAAAEDIWSISVGLAVSGNETINLRTRIFLRDIHGLYSNWREM
jgi:prepilin-type N-terminal cleavage/methylation domain-containing protein